MTDRGNVGQERREAETAEAKGKEGYGTVPNVAPDQAKGEAEELKRAMHELEEEKGDWSKDH